MRQDPGGGLSAWLALFAAAGRSRLPCGPQARSHGRSVSRVWAGASFLLCCRVQWSVAGQERGWRSKARLRAPVAAPACPCRELCPPVLMCGGGRAAPWQQPGPFLGPLCPLRWLKALVGSCLFPEGCSSSAGYRAPAHLPRVWGPACPTPGGPPLGAHSPCTWGPTRPTPGGPRCARPTSAGMGCVLTGSWGSPCRQPPQPPRQDRGVIGACPALA